MIQINDRNFGNILLIEVIILCAIYLVTYQFLKKWYRKRGKSLKDLAFKFGYIFILLSSIPFWLVKADNILFWERAVFLCLLFGVMPHIYHRIAKAGRISFRKRMGLHQCEEDMDDTHEKKIDDK